MCDASGDNPQDKVVGTRLLRWIWLLGAALSVSLSGVAQAAPDRRGERDEIPPELRDWVPWVLADVGSQGCAELGDERACVWPGRLELELEADGGEFELSFEADADGMAILVGGEGAWPERVEVDRKDVPVLAWQGHPAVSVSRGRHTAKGRFRWDRLPETLDVGPHTAFIELSVDDKRVPLVKREAGKVWLKGLGAEVAGEAEPEQVKLSVLRHIRDGVPLIVETLLVFQVAGRARELTLAEPLLQGTEPLSVTGDLAVALEASGALRVQLLPGRHEVTLLARHAEHPAELRNQARAVPWPPEEVWTFQPDPALRTVEASGLPGIDASRTELPEHWRSEGAYLAASDAVLTLTTTRRGQEQLPRNQLRLDRELWLDESAQAFTVRDHITGQMHQDWRLDLLSGTLGSVTVKGESQLITQDDGRLGVEVRDGSLDLSAVSRVKRGGALSAVGWSDDVDHLSARLYLPPGWDILSASGVDETSRTWLSRWDLFDVFYLLVVSSAMLRLTGWGGALAAAAALLLCRGEVGAPEYLWLPWVAAAALLGVLKPGRMRSVTRVCFMGLGLSLVVSLVGFSVDQVRAALYPHLGGVSVDRGFADFSPPEAPEDDAAEPELAKPSLEGADQAISPAAPPMPQALGKLGRGVAKRLAVSSRDVLSGGAYPGQQKKFKPDAIVQTGPGIPEATGRSVQLSWSGPVVRDHQVALHLISPGVNRLLTALRLLAVGAFLWVLYRRARRPADPGAPDTEVQPSPGRQATRAAGDAGDTAPARGSQRSQRRVLLGVLMVLLGAASALVTGVARADQPSDERLQQLKQRLTLPAECAPNCVSVSRMKIDLGDDLRISSEVHVGARSAYRLPGPASALSRVSLYVNRKRANAVRLHSDGAYYLRLDPGVHDVTLEAELNGDRVTLDVGTPPQRIEVKADGWTVTGTNQHGMAAGGTLTFQRAIDFEADGEKRAAAVGGRSQIAVPPFFTVERTLALGVASTVVTRITRVSAATNPEVFSLKLLSGERLTSPGVEVKAGVAAVTFPPEETQRVLQSTLAVPAEGEPLTLAMTAPAPGDGSETWNVECGVIYHCQTEGVVASSHLRGGQALLTFHPWPGETLTVTAREPPSAQGATLTVHKATLTLTPGVRTGRGELAMAVQTSRSLVHTVTIPKSARLERVSVGGQEQAVKSEDGKVRVSLAPGTSRVTVEWQSPDGLEAWYRAPAVNTGAPGVNLRTVVVLPGERWLLFAGGPSQGPALLFWGFLILIVLASAVLPRLPFSPLGKVQWLLLGLGLTQVPAGVAVFVAGWFFAMGSRRAWRASGRRLHNVLQLLLVGYTLLFLVALTVAVYGGLVSSPDMEVQGAGSSMGRLVWFEDRSSGGFSPVWALSVNLWIWRGFMLAWALWLARALIGWLRWAWAESCAGGFWAPPPAAPPAFSGGDAAAQGAASAAVVSEAEAVVSEAEAAVASTPAPVVRSSAVSDASSKDTVVPGAAGRSSVAPGRMSVAPGAAGPSSVAPVAESSAAPSRGSVAPGASSKSSVAPGASSKSSVAPGASSKSSVAPGRSSVAPTASGSIPAPSTRSFRPLSGDRRPSDPLPKPRSINPSSIPRGTKK